MFLLDVSYYTIFSADFHIKKSSTALRSAGLEEPKKELGSYCRIEKKYIERNNNLI